MVMIPIASTGATKKTIQVYKCTEPVAIPSDVRSRLMNALERKWASKRDK